MHGDINADGACDRKDIAALQQYLLHFNQQQIDIHMQDLCRSREIIPILEQIIHFVLINQNMRIRGVGSCILRRSRKHSASYKSEKPNESAEWIC